MEKETVAGKRSGTGREASSPSREPGSPEDLVHRNIRWLRGWLGARLRGRDVQEVDDLCQEVFLKALSRLETIRDTRKFPAWLYRIAANVLRDHLRKRFAERRIFSRGRGDLEPDRSPRNVEEKVALDEELERTVQALLSLPKKYREPMILRHVENLSYLEIGSMLGISENAVQVRIFRARQILRREVGMERTAVP